MQQAHMVLPSTCRLALLRQPLQSKNQIKSPMQERIIGSASGGGGLLLVVVRPFMWVASSHLFCP